MNKHDTTVKLRRGYTTGACAAAAAKGAATALFRQEPVTCVEIELPGEGRAGFEITRCVYDNAKAACAVIKDAGDDPDITNGAEISAMVITKKETGITVCGGDGVGTVTKPGLEIPAGAAAINPVPRMMIEQSVGEVLTAFPGTAGLEVTISVAGGEKLARKTLNPRLGITGGISIIGTTGIVIPYSPEAYKAAISQAAGVAAACGGKHAVITTGRRSEKYAQAVLELPEESFIQAGDYIGYALERCKSKGITEATIWGMTGKISKLAAGEMYTNISDSRIDIHFLTGVAAGCGAPQELLTALKEAVTANQLRRLLPPDCAPVFCNELCRMAAGQCRKATGGLKVHCFMSDYNGAILGKYHE